MSELETEIVRLRRYFHSRPELSFEEKETSAFIKTYLSNLGFAVKSGFHDLAVVADLGQAPFIAIRSDMDALPIQEQNISAYVSTNQGVMHACGHDAHMAVCLGAAKLAAESKQFTDFGLRLIFEPGTESKQSCAARELIEAGALEQVKAIFGFHVDSTMPVFEISIVKDAGISSSALKLRVNANENASKSELIIKTAELICRFKDITAERNGVQLLIQDLNFMESSAFLQGKISGQGEEQIEPLSKALQAAVKTDQSLEISLELEPLSANTSKIAEILEETLAQDFAALKQKSTRRRSWSHDFSYYGEYAPAAFFHLGTACGVRAHHSNSFELDERPLEIAARLLLASVLKCRRKLFESK